MVCINFNYLSTSQRIKKLRMQQLMKLFFFFSPFSVIHENEMPFMTTLQQSCCYFKQPWPVESPNKEQSVGITSSQCLLQKFPVYWPSYPLPISATRTATSTPYPENSLKPIEPSAEPFIDPCSETPIEPFIDPCTVSPEHSTESSIYTCIDLSTKSSTYYW